MRMTSGDLFLISRNIVTARQTNEIVCETIFPHGYNRGLSDLEKNARSWKAKS